MSEEMNLTLNGNSKVPPGFRFHPTEEELLHYYLRKKVASEKIDLDVIRDIDVNKLEPWEIQEKCKIGSTPQNDWYFFSHKDKKYPTGCRTNRATASGFWKATGRDKVIHSNSGRIGMRKTLVFYIGRAPHGQKSNWIMHEYRLDDHTYNSTNASNMVSGSGLEEGWVVCRVFKKKNYHKALDSPSTSSNLPRNEVVLDQILKCMGRSSSCKQEENESNTLFGNQPSPFLHFPQHEDRPSMNPSPSINWATVKDSMTEIGPSSGPTTDWSTLDRLVASQLNGQPSKHYSCYGEDYSFSFDHEIQEFTDLWNFGSCLYYPIDYSPTR